MSLKIVQLSQKESLSHPQVSLRETSSDTVLFEKQLFSHILLAFVIFFSDTRVKFDISVSGSKNKIMKDSYFIGLTIMESLSYPVLTLWTISSTFSFFPEVKELQWSYCVGSPQIYNKFIAVFFPLLLIPNSYYLSEESDFQQ